MNCGVNVDIKSFYQKGGLLEGSKKGDLGPPKEFFKTVSIPAFVSLSLKKHENNILYFIIFLKMWVSLTELRISNRPTFMYCKNYEMEDCFRASQGAKKEIG